VTDGIQSRRRRTDRARRSVAAVPFEAAAPSCRRAPGTSFESESPRSEPCTVVLRIYDVTGAEVVCGLNSLCRAIGTGAFHCGVEVYGLEWSFGFTDEGGSGVFSCDPGECGDHAYREAVAMGRTPLQEQDVLLLLSTLAQDWQGEDYDILKQNCCHFSDALCRRLGVGPIPGWITNLAGAGAQVEAGVLHAVSGVRSAAVIAAAKAMEIEQELALKKAVADGASHLMELDQRYAISESASEIACNAGDMVRAAAGAVEQVNDVTSTVVHKVTEAAIHRSANLAFGVASQVARSSPPIDSLSYMCLGGRKPGRKIRQ